MPSRALRMNSNLSGQYQSEYIRLVDNLSTSRNTTQPTPSPIVLDEMMVECRCVRPGVLGRCDVSAMAGGLPDTKDHVYGSLGDTERPIFNCLKGFSVGLRLISSTHAHSKNKVGSTGREIHHGSNHTAILGLVNRDP
ncbi:hypothetical protein Tco_0968378 [Tanacetum coccineum]